jgi:hypothetical protein
LCGQYLVVGLPFHDLLEVGKCCLHEIGDLLREFLDGGTGELVCRPHELRDTPLGLFGVELFFVEGLVGLFCEPEPEDDEVYLGAVEFCDAWEVGPPFEAEPPEQREA